MRWRGNIIRSALAALSLCFVSQSQATSGGLLPASQSAGSDIEFVEPVLGPFAYTHFCLRYAGECDVHGPTIRKPYPVKLTGALWSDLTELNSHVNERISPKRYVNDVSFDTWRISPSKGDCNDYAVTKRHELIIRGWPTRVLLLSEVITPWGEHHLVLLVRTDRGNFVLDNLSAQIRPWSTTGYRWVRIQMPSQPRLWSTIKAPSATDGTS